MRMLMSALALQTPVRMEQLVQTRREATLAYVSMALRVLTASKTWTTVLQGLAYMVALAMIVLPASTVSVPQEEQASTATSMTLVPLTLAIKLQSATQASLTDHTPVAAHRDTQALIVTKT